MVRGTKRRHLRRSLVALAEYWHPDPPYRKIPKTFQAMGGQMSDTGLQKLAFFLLILLILFVSIAGGV